MQRRYSPKAEAHLAILSPSEMDIPVTGLSRVISEVSPESAAVDTQGKRNVFNERQAAFAKEHASKIMVGVNGKRSTAAEVCFSKSLKICPLVQEACSEVDGEVFLRRQGSV